MTLNFFFFLGEKVVECMGPNEIYSLKPITTFSNKIIDWKN